MGTHYKCSAGKKKNIYVEKKICLQKDSEMLLVGGGLIWSKWTDLFGYPLKTCQMVPNDGKTTFFGVEIISKGVYPGFYE